MINTIFTAIKTVIIMFILLCLNALVIGNDKLVIPILIISLGYAICEIIINHKE